MDMVRCKRLGAWLLACLCSAGVGYVAGHGISIGDFGLGGPTYREHITAAAVAAGELDDGLGSLEDWVRRNRDRLDRLAYITGDLRAVSVHIGDGIDRVEGGAGAIGDAIGILENIIRDLP